MGVVASACIKRHPSFKTYIAFTLEGASGC